MSRLIRSTVANRASRFLVLGGVWAASVAGGAYPAASAPGAQAIPCVVTGQGRFVGAVQGRDYHGWLAVECLSPGDTLSNVSIHWGDGLVSGGTVGYEPPNSSGYVTALVVGDHVYSRATCTTSKRRCTSGYKPSVTATDEPSGKSVWGGGGVVLVSGKARKTHR